MKKITKKLKKLGIKIKQPVKKEPRIDRFGSDGSEISLKKIN